MHLLRFFLILDFHKRCEENFHATVITEKGFSEWKNKLFQQKLINPMGCYNSIRLEPYWNSNKLQGEDIKTRVTHMKYIVITQGKKENVE